MSADAAHLSVTETPNVLTEDLDVSVKLSSSYLNEIESSPSSAPSGGSAHALLRLLRESDAQLFAGAQGLPGAPADGFPSVFDEEVVDALEKVARGVAEALRGAATEGGSGRALVAISGAGTSGRLAFFAARTFSELLQDCVGSEAAGRVRFVYLTAGGDEALLRAREKTEDDFAEARQDLVDALAEVEECSDRAFWPGVLSLLPLPLPSFLPSIPLP
jgi:Glucokinase regulatory protein N-terminal SIS domain